MNTDSVPINPSIHSSTTADTTTRLQSSSVSSLSSSATTTTTTHSLLPPSPSSSSVTCPSFATLPSTPLLYVPKVLLTHKNTKRYRQQFEETKPPSAHGIDLVTNLSLYRYVTNEKGHPCRTVRPYLFLFHTFVKLRWQNREILEVFTTEFGGREPEYFKQAIANGCVQINNQQVDPHYRLQDGDYLVHIVHRHEPSVPTTPIHILYDNKDIIALTKPAGIPVHPCGPHHYLSMLAIAHKELGIDIRTLCPIHRLDRMTSGLLIYAKHGDIANQFSQQMKANLVHKRYFALVEGEFPLCPNRTEDVRNYIVKKEDFAKMTTNPEFPPVITFNNENMNSNEKNTDTPIDTTVWDTVNDGFPSSSTEGQCFPCFDRNDLVLRLPKLTTATTETIDASLSQQCPWLRTFTPRIVYSYYHDDEHTLNGEDARTERKRKYKEFEEQDIENSSVKAASIPPNTDTSASLTTSSTEPPHKHTVLPPPLPPSTSPTSSSSSTVSSEPSFPYNPETVGWTTEGYLRVNIALRILDHKNAVYGISDTTNNVFLPSDNSKLHSTENTHYSQSKALELPQYEKPSVTLFRRIATVTIPDDYTSTSSTTDTVPLIRSHLAGKTVSLIEALPLSGRTHQIRLHCSWIGYPIADDPVYCHHASEAVKKLMEEEDHRMVIQRRQRQQEELKKITLITKETVGTKEGEIRSNDESERKIIDQLEEACKSICTSCLYGEDVEFTPLQRFISGIALHSAEYQGPSLQSMGSGGSSNTGTATKTVSRYKRIYANNPRKFDNSKGATVEDNEKNDTSHDVKRNRVEDGEEGGTVSFAVDSNVAAVDSNVAAVDSNVAVPNRDDDKKNGPDTVTLHSTDTTDKGWHYLSPIPVWAGQILDMVTTKKKL